MDLEAEKESMALQWEGREHENQEEGRVGPRRTRPGHSL